METSPFPLSKPQTSCLPTWSPSQPAGPGQGHVAFVYSRGFSNTAGS